MELNSEELDVTDRELIEIATRIVDDQSDGFAHTVGAAVRDADGAIHAGVNLYHFTGGPCAELVALATARTNGAGRLTAIVAVGNDGRGAIAPCGRCRQVLLDYHPTIRVIVPTPDGKYQSASIEELLPLSYRWDPGT